VGSVYPEDFVRVVDGNVRILAQEENFPDDAVADISVTSDFGPSAAVFLTRDDCRKLIDWLDLVATPERPYRGFWRHERPGAYRVARLVCAIFGHDASKWYDEDGELCRGDCHRCWG